MSDQHIDNPSYYLSYAWQWRVGSPVIMLYTATSGYQCYIPGVVTSLGWPYPEGIVFSTVLLDMGYTVVVPLTFISNPGKTVQNIHIFSMHITNGTHT
jgi:hypothetical protein